MLSPAVSGQPLRLALRTHTPSALRANSVWQRWRSLHDDILRHVRACDCLGIELTIEQLAEELDEALGLVERRTEELCSLQLIQVHKDGRIELDACSQRMCG